MQSVCSRRSESSAAWRLYACFNPVFPSPMSRPTLLASTTLLRRPPRFSHLPITVSDSPPLWPGTQREYTSAVSMKLKPASSHASSSENDVASSAVQPNTLPPKHSGETFRGERPSVLYSIGVSSSSQFKEAHDDLVWMPRAGADEQPF